MQPIVLGILAGSIYALIAAGITLVYKSSRVLNFAQAELGTLTLYATYWVCTRHGQPWVVGALASVVLAVALGLLFEAGVIRQMLTASRLTAAVATIGLFSFCFAVESALFAGSIYQIPPPIAHGGFTLSGVFVSWSQVLALGVVIAV